MSMVGKKSIPYLTDSIRTALDLSNGTKFYRCALQLKPFAYVQRHKKQTKFRSDAEYNNAIINACTANGIEVVGITDHYRFQSSSMSLVDAAQDAGLWAFGVFEAVSKDGVHFLCLFNPNKDNSIERFTGTYCVQDSSHISSIVSLDSLDLLKKSGELGVAMIAADVASEGGLLKTLQGQARVKVWKSPYLLACALPSSIENVPDGIRQILQNKNAEYRRPYAVAIITASDVICPEDLKRKSTTCFIKMSDVSVEAFRQAFLDPKSRIRLNSDLQTEPHAELVSMSWEGGFLRDASVHFNSNLNVLIGGRGAGKSTIIESIRYVLGLEPIGEESQRAHGEVIKHVLRSGTKVSLLVRSNSLSDSFYTVERSVPHPPTVTNAKGDVLTTLPQELIPHVQVFGQHELSELARSPEKRTLLLKQFAKHDPSLSRRKTEIGLELKRSRSRIVEIKHEMEMLEDQLAMLPVLKEKQDHYRQAGIDKKLKEQSLLVKEANLFSIVNERLETFWTLHQELVDDLPIDTAFVSGKALAKLPNAKTLEEINKALITLSTQLSEIARQFSDVLSRAEAKMTEVQSHWDERRKDVQEAYEKLLRELQKSGTDGTEFIQLQKQIEKLSPLNDRLKNLEKDLKTHETHRYELLSEWEDIQRREYLEITDVARTVSKKLRDRVKVEVTMDKNREVLEDVFRTVKGNFVAALNCFRKIDQLSLRELSKRCREGKESLISTYDLPPAVAEKIAGAGIDLHMKIEEVELPVTTHIKLNTATDEMPAKWQTLDTLSTGQKATAVLLLLLLDSDAPLVIDQPEDDLDNRFITEGIVPIIRKKKENRQFIFSTHNANIPVLGDADLILGLTASGEAGWDGHATIESTHMGSIDSCTVRELVEETLEGGKDAFEMRRSKYGF